MFSKHVAKTVRVGSFSLFFFPHSLVTPPPLKGLVLHGLYEWRGTGSKKHRLKHSALLCSLWTVSELINSFSHSAQHSWISPEDYTHKSLHKGGHREGLGVTGAPWPSGQAHITRLPSKPSKGDCRGGAAPSKVKLGIIAANGTFCEVGEGVKWIGFGWRGEEWKKSAGIQRINKKRD